MIRSEPPARFKSRIASPREPRPSENSNRKHIHSDYSDTRAKESAQAKTSVFCTTNLGVQERGMTLLVRTGVHTRKNSLEGALRFNMVRIDET